MILQCNGCELRGITKRTSNDGKKSYVANFEDFEGTPFQLFLGGDMHLLEGYNKGSLLNLMLDYVHSTKGNFLKLVGVGKCE